MWIKVNLEMPALSTTAAFSGYRPTKLPEQGSKRVQTNLQTRLRNAILETLNRGYTTYLNGCMAGWDILAAEVVLELRKAYPEIKCISIAPFRRAFLVGPNWTPEWRARALAVYRQSDQAFALEEQYRRGIYYARDRFLIDHAALLICYYDGQPGGTSYTVHYAESKGHEMINLAREQRMGEKPFEINGCYQENR